MEWEVHHPLHYASSKFLADLLLALRHHSRYLNQKYLDVSNSEKIFQVFLIQCRMTLAFLFELTNVD